MKVTNHGDWERYTPAKHPEGLPENVMFCRRKRVGKVWYQLIHKDKPFSPLTIKMTVMEGKVQAVNRDEERLFPQGCTVLELEGDDVADPQTKYGGLLWDKRDFHKPPPVDPGPDINDLLKRIQQLEEKLRAKES